MPREHRVRFTFKSRVGFAARPLNRAIQHNWRYFPNNLGERGPIAGQAALQSPPTPAMLRAPSPGSFGGRHAPRCKNSP